MEIQRKHHQKFHRNVQQANLFDESLCNDQSSCHFCQLQNFSTWEKFPIEITNTVDQAALPPDFEFIEQSILSAGVEPAAEDFRTGCACKHDEDCQMQLCSCLQDMDFGKMKPGPRVKVYAYQYIGPNQGCLRKVILQSREPIYECQDSCQCSLDCKNGVVERGRQIPLEIFRTADGRGWGVRSGVDIKEGQYVDKYVGEIITSEEADHRREESDIAQRKDVYLFALDKFSDPDSNDPRFAGRPLEVDGEFKSGPTRFINHSCNPNLRSFARVGDHADKHIHDLALFAIRMIPAGEELTFDYVDGITEDDEDELLQDAESTNNKERCLCGSENCRGYLW